MQIIREAYIEGIRCKELELAMRKTISESRKEEFDLGEDVQINDITLRIKNKTHILKNDTLTIKYNLIEL